MLKGAGRRILTHPATVRTILAGPVSLIGAIIIMAAMPLWFPAGSGGIDNLIFPVLLLPGIWAALFFHAILTRNVWHAVWVQSAVILLHAIAAFVAATGGA